MFYTAVLFACFALGALLSAVMVVTSRNPVHSVLALVLSFVNCSALLLLMNVEFIALLFLVVYVGAIAVLFLFVVMMLNVAINDESERLHTMPLIFFLGILFLGQAARVLSWDWGVPGFGALATEHLSWASLYVNHSSLKAIGSILYTRHVGHFLLAGLILLVAMLGAIALTLTRRVSWTLKDARA